MVAERGLDAPDRRARCKIMARCLSAFPAPPIGSNGESQCWPISSRLSHLNTCKRTTACFRCVATLPLRCPMAPPPPSLQSSYVRPPRRRRFASRAPPRKPQSPAWGSKQHVGEAASHTPVRAISSASTKCSREAAGGRRGFVSFSAVVLCKTALKGYSPGLQIR